MKYWTEYSEPADWELVRDNKKNIVSDSVFTLDTEASSGFKYKNTIIPFEYDKPYSFYVDLPKCAWLYVWQLGINDSVYYGRTIEELQQFLERINTDCPDKKIFYIHNMGYDIQWLFNALDLDNIDMFARKCRAPMKVTIPKYNIEIRCSYMLTNLGLEKCASFYRCAHKKLVGNLDYNKLIYPTTKLSDEELSYAENDILVMNDFLHHFRDKYEHIYNIPLTQTGEVRRELQKLFKGDIRYIHKVQDMYAGTVYEWDSLNNAFMGGYTHGNALNVGFIHRYTDDGRHIQSKDIASSYPNSMTFKLPMGRFIRTRKRDFDYENKAYIIKVRWYDIESKYFNNYIPISKCIDHMSAVLDNGRVASAKMIEMQVTHIDYEIIKSMYTFSSEDIIEVLVCNHIDYLDKRMLEFILKSYSNKTTLKGLDEYIAEYNKGKQMINCMYGNCVTRIVNPVVTLTPNRKDLWHADDITDEFKLEKLKKQKKNWNCLNNFAWGVFITAYSRMALMELVKQMDYDVIYMDTDSIKYKGDYEQLFIDYNKKNADRLKAMCDELDIDYELCHPKDIKGIEHPLGAYEDDGFYDNGFITLGAKKYAYVDDAGEIHITVSGVSKKAATQLSKLEDFKDDFLFDAEHCGKQLLSYIDNQEPFNLPDGTIIKQKYAIHMMPTTYKLSSTTTRKDNIEAIQQRGYQINYDPADLPFE